MNTATRRLTMAQALVEYLQVQHSERDGQTRRLIPAIFGIFGHGNVTGMGQALEEYGAELPYYHPCNEQSMVHTAAGFAKAKRRLATLACTSSIGPGATNMISGAAAATINRLPVLLLPGDYYATRHQGPVLQQLEHPISGDVSVNDCFRPVSRFFDRIMRPEQLLTALPEAMRVLTDPADTGAVTLSLPQDVQTEAWEYPAHFFGKRVWPVERPQPEARRLTEAVALLKKAKRPLIVAGGGVHYSEAWDELARFATACGIPVSETFAGKGAVQRSEVLLLGGQGTCGTPLAAKVAHQADLVICVGTRLADFITGSQSVFQHSEVRFLSLNVCSRDAHKQGALPLVADAREGLRALRQAALEAGVKPQAEYLRQLEGWQREWQSQIEKEILAQAPGEAMSQGQLVHLLNEEARSGDVVITAAGGLPSDLLKMWDARGGKECQMEFGYSCMGYEIPAGLGVRMAQSSGEVYVFIGDGTYLMNPTELVTAMQEGLKITLVISDNCGYQCIRALQVARAGHAFGNEFRRRNPQSKRLDGEYLDIDLAGNAASMGARVWRASTPAEVRQALGEARAETRTCAIVVPVEKHRYLPPSGVWIDFATAQTSQDPLIQKQRREYEADQQKQRFYY
jgi:3D-(3,5/4)-trihydroxycyclohexane-1,2-dione acylhydrolase (decyclizing)